jgi:hypothetical protein
MVYEFEMVECALKPAYFVELKNYKPPANSTNSTNSGSTGNNDANSANSGSSGNNDANSANSGSSGNNDANSANSGSSGNKDGKYICNGLFCPSNVSGREKGASSLVRLRGWSHFYLISHVKDYYGNRMVIEASNSPIMGGDVHSTFINNFDPKNLFQQWFYDDLDHTVHNLGFHVIGKY